MGGHHAVILAAGKSARMGREKASLPWVNGALLLAWMVEALSSNGWKPIAVVRPERLTFWKDHLPAGCVVANPHPEHGKTTSLTTGIENIAPAASWILLTSVDQPRPPELYGRLLDATVNPRGKILVPDRQGGRGHPVVLDGGYRESLLSLDEKNHGLRGLLDANRSETYRLPACDPANLHWDMNTPEAYAEAMQFFQSQATVLP